MCRLLSNEERCKYQNSQLMDVVCQLRFPTILSITASEPAQFQEAIRMEYPRYAAQKERPAPKVTGLGTDHPTLEQQPPVTNFCFVSDNGKWRVNLTNRFIALSTQDYRDWEDFAARLDRILAAFISCYQPFYFERIGLRYINAFSRENLGLADVPWSELIEPPYLGVLAEGDVPEQAVAKSAMDVEMALPHGCRLKLHAGPGMLRRNGQAEKQTRFIFDMDLSMTGQMTGVQIAGALSTLHSNSTSVFRGAISPRLHEAMEPQE